LDDKKYPILEFDAQNQTLGRVRWLKMVFTLSYLALPLPMDPAFFLNFVLSKVIFKPLVLFSHRPTGNIQI
jgi:hypothetical protein